MVAGEHWTHYIRPVPKLIVAVPMKTGKFPVNHNLHQLWGVESQVFHNVVTESDFEGPIPPVEMDKKPLQCHLLAGLRNTVAHNMSVPVSVITFDNIPIPIYLPQTARVCGSDGNRSIAEPGVGGSFRGRSSDELPYSICSIWLPLRWFFLKGKCPDPKNSHCLHTRPLKHNLPWSLI